MTVTLLIVFWYICSPQEIAAKVQLSVEACVCKWRNMLATYRNIKRRYAQSYKSGGKLEVCV